MDGVADNAEVLLTVAIPASVVKAALSAAASNPTAVVSAAAVASAASAQSAAAARTSSQQAASAAASSSRSAAAASSSSSRHSTATTQWPAAANPTSTVDTLGVFSLSSLAIKPVINISTDPFGRTVTGSSARPTATNNAGDDAGAFSSMTSPAAVAMTSVGSIALAAILIGLVAFFLRRSKRRRARQARYGGQLGNGRNDRYSDLGSFVNWSKEQLIPGGQLSEKCATELPQHLALPTVRANRELREQDAHIQQGRRSWRNSYQAGHQQPAFLHTIIPASDDGNNTSSGSSASSVLSSNLNDMPRRKSSMDKSLMRHLNTGAPSITTPSMYQAETLSQWGMSQTSEPQMMVTAASSPFMDPPAVTTSAGPISHPDASPVPPPIEKDDDVNSVSSLAPPRPIRPASLTSSFKRAIDNEYSAKSPFLASAAIHAAKGASHPPAYSDEPSPKSTPNIDPRWSRLPAMSPSAGKTSVGGLLASPLSTNYAEEKADLFMALPSVMPPRRKSSTSRWMPSASDRRQFGSTGSLLEPNMANMGSRFSVTTLGSGDDASIHGDWQVRTAARQPFVLGRRAPPQLIAQRSESGSSIPASIAVRSDVDTLGEPLPMFSYTAQPSDSPFADPSEWTKPIAPLDTSIAAARRSSQATSAAPSGEISMGEAIRKRSIAALYAEDDVVDVPY